MTMRELLDKAQKHPANNLRTILADQYPEYAEVVNRPGLIPEVWYSSEKLEVEVFEDHMMNHSTGKGWDAYWFLMIIGAEHPQKIEDYLCERAGLTAELEQVRAEELRKRTGHEQIY